LAGRSESSLQSLEWLSSLQNDDGSVGPTAELKSPGWPTALAIMAAGYVGGTGEHDVLGLHGKSGNRARIQSKIRFDTERAAEWLLDTKGGTLARQPSMGHDSTLVGWPWVAGTHSWIEPTALAVLALKSIGHGDHPRTREGVRVLHDRLLPSGGCNCGNTIVFGQELLPHVQPTGLTLLALFGEKDHDGRIERSLKYLEREVNGESAVASMAYGVWALARYDRVRRAAHDWLAAAARRRSAQESPLRMALLLLADAAVRQHAGPALSLHQRTS
jgi:hypothetical protein